MPAPNSAASPVPTHPRSRTRGRSSSSKRYRPEAGHFHEASQRRQVPSPIRFHHQAIQRSRKGEKTMNDNMSPVLSFVGRSSVGSASARPGASTGDNSSWYEAMSKAWGQTLDAQASRITNLSDVIGSGGDQPSNMVKLTAESLKMQFLSNNAEIGRAHV